VLTAVLAATAVVAGVTGAWSPCGFSMVDTLAAAAREDGRRILPPALLAFTAGALAGGAIMFGGLALAGSALHTGGDGLAEGVAVAVAAAAALAEAAGVRIRPQVRRQVPEGWRRSLPLPLAAGLYGVLLGVGFATFVLTLAVGALALICLASGKPSLGLAVGVGFGAGRALPVLLLAPVAERPAGLRALELMAERPLALRGLRAACAAALAVSALTISTGTAWGATLVARGATDPSVSGGALAWQRPGGSGVSLAGGRTTALPGTDPSLGEGFLALRAGDRVDVFRGAQRIITRTVPGVGKLAVSGRWLAWRRSLPGGGDAIEAAPLVPGAAARRIATVAPPSQLGRPDLSGDRLVYHVAGRGGSALRDVNLRSGRRLTLARSGASQLLNPALAGTTLVYVRISRCGQRLVLRRHRRSRTLLRGRALAGRDAGFEPGHTSQGSRRPCRSSRHTSRMLWSTAVSPRFAYVTLFRPGGASSLVRVAR
jgi:hypothetical protein